MTLNLIPSVPFQSEAAAASKMSAAASSASGPWPPTQGVWPAFTTRPQLMTRHHAVTAGHYLAAAAGERMFTLGGNAFDAAVAMGLASAVVEPQYYSLGGEVSILLYSAREEKPRALCGQGVASAAATIGWFREHGYAEIPGNGMLAATVPGVFGAWMTLLREYGTLRVEQVLAPAVELAEQGYPAHPGAINAIAGALRAFPSTAAALGRAQAPCLGGLMRNPGWAGTFRDMAERCARKADRLRGIDVAHDMFYRGRIAKRLTEFCMAPPVSAKGPLEPGLLTRDDLAAWHARVEDPVQADYRGYTVCKCGPWSQGPVFLQQLALLEGFDLKGMGHNSADTIHTITEGAKLAFADRDASYGDPDFVEVPLSYLLSQQYADERRKLIDPGCASHELRPGIMPRFNFKDRAGLDFEPESLPEDTTHLDAIDIQGNIVAATPSGGWIDMSPIVPELGFPLGVRAQMFRLNPEHPNALQPGKRPRTTLSPTLVMRDDKPLLAFGTLGGDNQDQWTLQFFLNHVEFGMTLQAAIDAPSAYTGHLISSWAGQAAQLGSLMLEDRIPAAVREDLATRGHTVQNVGPWSNGRVLAVAFDHLNGTLHAAASPRAETAYTYGW